MRVASKDGAVSMPRLTHRAADRKMNFLSVPSAPTPRAFRRSCG